MNLNDYTLAGYTGRQTDDPIYSSSPWLAEEAGKVCRNYGILPSETKMSRGYSVVVNRVFVIKFDTSTLKFVSITRRNK